MESELVIKIENLKKEYRLGILNGRTLSADLQSLWARWRKKEDPNIPIYGRQNQLRERFWALNGIDLEVYKGETVGVIGANGSGKSTLLKLLSRITAPTKGSIKIKGRISGILEVGTGFHGELTGRENAYLNGAILGMSVKEIDDKMESIIKFSECGQFIDTPIKRYSSGMYVKLAFAIASHLDSEILIMDEVLAVGDIHFQKKCIKKMYSAANTEGKTIFYVSHNMSTIRQLCSRCIVLDKGKIIFNGKTEEAIVHYSGLVQQDYATKNLNDMPREKHFIKKGAKMLEFEQLKNQTGIYAMNEKMFCRLKVESSIISKNVFFRVAIHHVAGEPFTMMTTQVPFSLNQGMNDINFILDLQHIVAGKYLLNLVLYEMNQHSEQNFLDGLPDAVCFEIEESANVSNGLQWSTFYWGNVALHPILVSE